MLNLQDKLANLSPEKRALIELQLAVKEARAAGRNSIPRRSETGPALLSFAQQRLWFLDQFQPGTALYNIPSAQRLTGALDLPALQRSLDELVRRHESLRTTFAVIDNEPEQIIHAPSAVPLP